MCPQPTLFDATPCKLAGDVFYYPNFIDHADADEILSAFMKLKWRQHIYRGMSAPAPREYVWMGIPYTSPNLINKLVVNPWTPEAMRVKALVEEKTGCTFDSLNLNRYRYNRDSIGLHSDGEKEGLWSFPIASVSLGAERMFQWKNNKDGSTTRQLLGHGSLLVMPPGFQRDYKHELPKQRKECGPRINLTFRRKVAS